MKRWAFVVAGLYLLMLAALTVPAILLAFAGKIGIQDAAKTFATWQYWAWMAIMIASQLALLMVPVRVASRRPVTQEPLWMTILAGALMMAGLVTGAALSIWEFLFRDKGFDASGAVALGLTLLTWLVWTGIFYRMSRGRTPADFVTRQCRVFLAGSILELLIAVPTHIVARSRDYCCAGFMTFIGLTMGICVMLFSYGPGVLLLYAERWIRLHPRAAK